MPDSHPDPFAGDNPDEADPRLVPLLAWRQQLIDSGAVAARSFKEAHLRLVLRSGRTDVDQIRAMLPGSVAAHAEDMARVLTELATATTQMVPLTPPVAPPPPAVPPPSDADPGATEQTSITGRHRVSDAAAVAPPSLPPVVSPAAGPAEVSAPPEVPEVAETSRAPESPVVETAPVVIETPLQGHEFAPFTFAAQRPPAHNISLRRDAAGLQLSWPALQVPEGVVLYRAVSTEDNPPYAPDRADLVGATVETAVTDPRPPASAVRHYQVWINIGASREEALAAQPMLYAAGVVVSPIVDFVIREDAGRVIGQWSVPAGVSSVYVYRVPVAEAGRDGPQYRILAGNDNLTGFVDADTVRGERYQYRARCAAMVDGVLRLSEAVESAVEVSAVLAPVSDLAVGTSVDGGAFDLTWTPPAAGRVVIYRSDSGPNAGADAGELPEDALEQVGLGPELRLTQPVVTQSGQDGRTRMLMAGVSWPEGWSRAYLTPVTILAGRALLGRTLSSVRTGTIRDIELAEYCNKQVLTFDWPDGAAGVVMYLAPKGHDPRTGLTGKSFEISLEEYEKYGGMQLTGQLPVGGCSLHLAPVAFSGGRRVTGAIASIEYAGLLRLQYAVRIGRDPQGLPATATVAMRSEHDLPGSPAFVLVNNPQRIPLSVHDGQAVDVAPLDAQGQLMDRPSKELRWSQLTTTGTGELWAANVRGLQGWIRLFVNTPSAERLRVIALLDPPVDSLRLTAPVQ